MTRISSTTLFNFTDSIEFLISNLKEGFYCSYAYEKLPLKNNGYKAPMACFCDIPLSLIKEHFDWYGRYGIGIKRSYARENGVQPVWYVTSENNLVKSLVKNKKLSDYERKHLLPYLKQFFGSQYFEKEKKEKNKKFYDEHEWRYIPDNSMVEPFFNSSKSSIPVSTYIPPRMALDLSQVEYIIIDKEAELKKMLIELKSISISRNISYETLVSKIMTSKQIERDF